jgi:cephalosporin hydroxylase
VKLALDTRAGTLTVDDGNGPRTIPLYSREGFEALSNAWLKVGWNQKHPYTFSWLGRPVIQLPEDLLRIQEVVHRVRPDAIVETGVAHGGSLVFYASLCKLIGTGRVVGVEVALRPENRRAIQSHTLASYITLVDGDAVAPETVARVREAVGPGRRTLVILDACHTRRHVAAELEAYHDLVAPGSYLVATDGIMKDLTDVPRGQADWATDNPLEAVRAFLRAHGEFVQEQPPWPFNESELARNVTHWPGAWLRRLPEDPHPGNA